METSLNLCKKVFLIVNPGSGTLKSRSGLFEIVDTLSAAGALVTVHTTQARGHATELADMAARSGNYDIIACCGGDGTLNETISGVLASGVNIPLGYIPAGSTNDFAASMGIPSDMRAAADIVIHGTPYLMDVGSWDGSRYFSYIASFGAFTAASYNAPQPTKNALGHLAYILEGVKDLQNLRPQHVTATANGKTYSGDYIFCAVSNSTSVGGIVKLNRDAVSFNDGYFEVILVRSPTTITELAQILQAVQNSDYSGRMFDFFHANEINFDMYGPVSWSLDGERADGGRLISVRCLPRVLTVMRPHED